MKRKMAASATLLLSALAWGQTRCGESPPRDGAQDEQLRGKLVITGSSTLAPLVNEMGKSFEAQNPEVRVDVQTGGSSRGVADARRGVADIGMVSRQLTTEESDLRSYEIARDGVCLIVHKENPVSELSSRQVADIFTGRIGNWIEVGGEDAEIVVVTKAEGRATLDVFLKYFELPVTAIRANVIIGDNEEGIKTVAGNPRAVGFVSIGTAEYDVAEGVPIKLLPMDNVPPSSASLSRGVYPISRPLNLVTKGNPKDLARRFIEFCLSESVSGVIEQQHFVSPAG